MTSHLGDYSADQRELIRRHTAFWAMEETDTPLIRVSPYRPTARRKIIRLLDGTMVRDGTRLLPENLDMSEITPGDGRISQSIGNGFIPCLSPYDLCWTEAVAGCPIYWQAGHVWADTPRQPDDGSGFPDVTVEKSWLDKLIELARLLVESAKGEVFVSQPLLRGPVDIAAAVLGDERLCYFLADEPEQAKQFLLRCADVFIQVAREWWAEVPRFLGGFSIYDLWTPGSTVRIQCDNAVMLSSAWYREFLLPCDERICAAFEYPIIHTHSRFIDQVAEPLLSLETLSAIQVSLDYPGGPAVIDLLPVFRSISGNKPLVITGVVSPEELETLQRELSPRGLCLQLRVRPGPT